MDIKGAGDKLDQADNFLDKFWKFLGKHWGKLTIILVCYCIYLFIGMVGEEMNKDTEPQNIEAPYIIETYEEVGESGEILVIEVWSDGVETVADDK